MDKLDALETLKAYPSNATVSDLYDQDKEFSSVLATLYPHTFEYPDFSHRKISDIIKSIEKLNKTSEASLAVEHQRAHFEFRKNSGKLDFQRQRAIIEEMDMVAIALADIGWTNEELSANALGISIGRFNEFAKAGIYEQVYGVPPALLGRSQAGKPVATPEAKPADLNARYADSIIKGNSAFYNALEVHGVRDLNPPNHPQGTHCEIDESNPQFYSVYVRGAGNGETVEFSGIEAVGDFAKYFEALAYANELAAQYHYPVHDFTLHDRKIQMDVSQSADYAEKVASEKATFSYVDPSINQTQTGKVMGAMDHHVVLSVGRKAMIFEKSLFGPDTFFEAGNDMTVRVEVGRASIVPEKDKGVGVDR